MKPVAYAMFRDGEYYDAIHPDEYVKTAGEYDIPLYTYPAKTPMLVLDGNRVYSTAKTLTDEEIKDFIATFPIIFTPDDLVIFARAILRKAQE
jgi:hypothetical protein